MIFILLIYCVVYGHNYYLNVNIVYGYLWPMSYPTVPTLEQLCMMSVINKGIDFSPLPTLLRMKM